nr:ankyrin repeat-containing protein NPR4-like isoform X3 [Quercus suber]
METKLALSAAVLEALNEDNYMDWSVQLKTYLVAQDLWEIVGSRSEPPPVRENEAAYKAWSKKNAIALHAIQMSCRPDTFSDIREISSARIAWNLLAEKYETRDPNPSSSEEEDSEEGEEEDGEEEEEEEEDSEEGGELSDSSASSGESDEGNINDGVEIYLDLYKALQIGDWDAIEDFLNRHPHAISAKITSRDKTALHVAAEAGHVHIVEELVNLMSEENLEIKDNKGRTALDGVACRGNYRMAECMLEKNERLIRIEDDNGNIPVVMALYNGHLILARYLYLHTPLEILMPENSTMGASIIYEAILNKALDIALHLAQRSPSLVLAKARNGDSPFYALSRMPDAFPSGNRLVFWKRWIYSGLYSWSQLVSNLRTLLGIEHLYEMKLAHCHSRELLSRINGQILISSKKQRETGCVNDAILRAVKEGIFEFVFDILKTNPDLVWSHDEKSTNIFSVAVQHRRAKIFNLIYGLDTKNSLASGRDDFYGNNLLHMAGMPAPSTSLDHIPGAALQMQRELQWFKEVESIVPPRVLGKLNDEDLTPRQLFTKNHKDMMGKGEKWMKDTASSCTVVGALIITIMFAAAFTVPGGNDQNNGFPIFLNKKLFMVFIVSDALSLFSSTTSVLMFLGILTSRYEEEDFLESLPRKMIIGLSAIFFSIAAMMTAFSTALILMLHEQSWVFKPIIFLASIPIALFVLMQFPLLVEMVISTYGPSIFDRKMKRQF